MTSLEQREATDNVGEPWSPVTVRQETDEAGNTHTIRTRYYTNGKIEEVDGEAWFLIEKNAVNLFP